MRGTQKNAHHMQERVALALPNNAGPITFRPLPVARGCLHLVFSCTVPFAAWNPVPQCAVLTTSNGLEAFFQFDIAVPVDWTLFLYRLQDFLDFWHMIQDPVPHFESCLAVEQRR